MGLKVFVPRCRLVYDVLVAQAVFLVLNKASPDDLICKSGPSIKKKAAGKNSRRFRLAVIITWVHETL